MLAEVRDAYARKAKLGEDAISYAHSIKISAEVLLGGFLKETEKRSGGQRHREKWSTRWAPHSTANARRTRRYEEAVGRSAGWGVSDGVALDVRAHAAKSTLRLMLRC